MKMSDREFLIKWIEALRSGDYKQGHEYLFSSHTGGYCCLGVGADLCDIPTEEIEDIPYLTPAIRANHDLPNYIASRKWELIFSSLNDGSYVRQDSEYNYEVYNFCKKYKLGRMDARAIKLDPHSFEEIADIIEKYILNKLPDKN